MRQPAVSRLAGSRVTSIARFAALSGTLRRHWLATLLITAGVVLRALTQMAYHPAIVYIDTLKYLYPAWPGSDPIGYKIPLRLILAFGSLGTVEFIQHLLGIGMAVAIYAVLVRRGAPRWLGALAMTPVLLDAYQLQAEAMIMPDVWFEAMVVAGAALLLWRSELTMPRAIAGAAFFGASVGMRQVGEILIVPALVYVAALGGGLRVIAKNAITVTVAFGLAVLLYMTASFDIGGHFYISRSSLSLTYGRMATVADCATLQLPKIERPLCPTRALQLQGPDQVEHAGSGPYRLFIKLAPPGTNADTYVQAFNQAVETQQPLRVVGGILRDAVKLFALTRYRSQGDTPLWRWQFQSTFPSYCPYIIVGHCPGSYSEPANQIWVSYPRRFPGGGTARTFQPLLLNPAYGGAPQVNRSIAGFLRGYQRGGGYTPGPLYLLAAITGLLGSVALLLRGRRKLAMSSQTRQLALACLLFFATALTVLAISDFFEFSWRYQLPAIVTLPPAGALGIAVLIAVLRGPARAPGPAAQAAAPASVPGRAEAPAPAPVPETPAVKTP